MGRHIRRKPPLNIPLLIIGILCLLAAGGLAVHNVWTIHKSNAAIEEMKDGMEEAMMEAIAERAAEKAAEPSATPETTEALEETEAPEAEETPMPEETVTPAASATSTPSSASKPAATTTPTVKLDTELDMPTWSWKEFTYIGYIEIPSLGLNLPVMSTYSSYLMAIAPCRYQGSVTKGNLVIAGHNYEKHFGNLKTLKAGDAVSFTDADGTVYNYSVTGIETIKPSNTAAMITGDWDLTIFTCNTYGTQRIAVRCALN